MRCLRSLPCLAVAALVALLPACDSSNPSGPRTRVITVIAEPAVVDPGESSNIRVQAVTSDGAPAAGEAVAMATNLGSLADDQLTLDSDGMAMTTFEAGNQAGQATVAATMEAGGDLSMGVVTVVVRQIQPPELAAEPVALSKDHQRSVDPCPNPFDPVELTNVGDGELEFRVTDDLPPWLDSDLMEGPVPATLNLEFNCNVGDGDLDLSHTLTLQGIDGETLEDSGDPVLVEITVNVRD